MIEALIFVVFPFCMVFAATSDMLSMTIANRVSLVLVALFPVVAPFAGMEWSAVAMHLTAGAAVLCITFAMFALGAMGGGDAKLISATSVWLGFTPLLMQYLVYASLLGGLLTVAILLFRGSALAAVSGTNPFLRHFADREAGIPYGIALGAAGLLVYPSTPLVAWALESVAIQ